MSGIACPSRAEPASASLCPVGDAVPPLSALRGQPDTECVEGFETLWFKV